MGWYEKSHLTKSGHRVVKRILREDGRDYTFAHAFYNQRYAKDYADVQRLSGKLARVKYYANWTHPWSVWVAPKGRAR